MPRQHHENSHPYTSSRYNTAAGERGGGRYPKYQPPHQRPLGADAVLPLNRSVIPIDKLIKHQQGKHASGSQMTANKQVSPSGGSNSSSSSQVILAPLSHAVQQQPSVVVNSTTGHSNTFTVNNVSPSSRKPAHTSHVLSDDQKKIIKKVNLL